MTKSLTQKGKVIIITGASSGIGWHGIAISFAKANADTLILAGRNKNGLESAAADIHKVAPPDIRVIDISNENEVKKLFECLRTDYRQMDVLVNNAGSGESPLPIAEVQAEKWWYKFEVMVKGTFLMTQQFLQLNGKDTDMTIINIVSAAALNCTPCLSSYSWSKLCRTQLQSFVRSENSRIRAISLRPGIITTGLTPPAFQRFAKDTFDLVGGVVIWLASAPAGFMNGRYISLNRSVDELLERKEENVFLVYILVGNYSESIAYIRVPGV